jgi:hypothetical protein
MLALRRKPRRFFASVDTVLTLVIALGGIATGIGAIWAAVLARRQAQLTERSLEEQRRFLEEQNQIARNQAQVTERSFAEQNERARLSLAFDLVMRLRDRFDSPGSLRSRREAAKFLLQNAFAEDGAGEVPSLSTNNAAMTVCNFFAEVGELQRIGVLSAETVWNNTSDWCQAYWLMCKPAVEKMRQEWENPGLYAQFERLGRLMAEMDRERGIAPPRQNDCVRSWPWRPPWPRNHPVMRTAEVRKHHPRGKDFSGSSAVTSRNSSIHNGAANEPTAF